MARKSTPRKSLSKNDAGDVTRSFYLNDISLWESALRRDREFRWGDHSPENCATQTFRVVEPEIIEVDVQGEEDRQIMLRAMVKLGIRVIHKNEDNPNPFYTLEATYCADYFILTPPSEDVFSHFVEFNCVHNVWPFWRQHVFDTLKRASLPVPSVPLYAGQGKYRKKKVNITRVLATSEGATAKSSNNKLAEKSNTD